MIEKLYFKRIKNDKEVQVICVEHIDWLNFRVSVLGLESKYNQRYAFMKLTVPQDELEEISFEEFCAVCNKYNLLAKTFSTPEPFLCSA